MMALSNEYMNYGVILLVIAGASYVQAISGFAFALIVMGVIPSLNLMEVADAAIVVTILAMVNTATALSKGFANVRWREAATSLMFSMPSIAIGLYLLDLLSGSHLGTLRIALGVTILFSGIMLLKPPHQDAAVSKWPSFAIFGFLSGLISGLFSTGGPPVVFQFYRQPWPLPVIRDSLFVLFFVGSTARTAMVAFDTGIEERLLVLSAIALPVVVVFTKIGQRYAPGFSDTTIRRAVFGLLTLAAAALMIG
jgi:uncharacterized protein